MYAKCGSLDDARRVFDAMPRHDIVSWNSLLFGYAQDGDADAALELLSRIEEESRGNVVPNSLSYIAALKACSAGLDREKGKQEGSLEEDEDEGEDEEYNESKLEEEKSMSMDRSTWLDKGMRVHSRAARCGFSMDLMLLNAVIHMYCKCGAVRYAQHVFDQMPHRDVISYTSLISGYGDSGHLDAALGLVSLMHVEATAPNAITFVAALKAISACAARQRGELVAGKKKLVKVAELRAARRLHDQVSEMDLSVANTLLRTYSKCGSLEEMRHVFDSMAVRDVVSWNAAILGYAENEVPAVALELFSEMTQQRKIVPDTRTYVAVLKACAAAADAAAANSSQNSNAGSKEWWLEAGIAIHSRMVAERRGGEIPVMVANSLVTMYAKSSKLEEARAVFDRMRRRTVVSWNALLFAYAESGAADGPRAALELFAQMPRGAARRDGLSYVAALKACAALGDVDAGRRLHAALGGAARRDPVLASALVNLYGKCGSLEEARRAFESLDARARDLVAWNALLEAYGHRGDARGALAVFERMVEGRVAVNGVTFLAVLTACSHAGLMDAGRRIFHDMISRFGIAPNILHYTCLVDLLGRGNHVDEAVRVARNMPFEADVAVWAAILGAAEKWRNLGVAEMAFEEMIRVDSGDAGAYVVMANVYRSAGMVEESRRVLQRGVLTSIDSSQCSS